MLADNFGVANKMDVLRVFIAYSVVIIFDTSNGPFRVYLQLSNRMFTIEKWIRQANWVAII